MRRNGVSTSDESRSATDLRLAKAKVAGSNPVFRSDLTGVAIAVTPESGVCYCCCK